MIKRGFILYAAIFFVSCHNKIAVQKTTYFPKQTEMITNPPGKQNVWVFILAGQSNMAGRGIVKPQDTIPNDRILSIDKNGEIIIAKEPLHWYEPALTGLDCGASFGKTMIKHLPDSVSILLIPAAIGGSSISQWINDSLYRGVKLLSNFKSKAEIGKQYGIIKGILWHQGETDANEKDIPYYKERLALLISKFRAVIGNNDCPVLLGELASFSKYPEYFKQINNAIHDYSLHDKNTSVILTSDLKDKGDSLHFNAAAQRTMGRRFAQAWLKKFK
jgi:Carbohydrate esterase, sialic acid-specific acetylesterase